MLYALGEILLIVVGILLAVQINNWNEAKKEASQRTIYEASLLSELENDIDRLKDLSSRNTMKRNSILNYLDYYNSAKRYV